MNTGPNEKRARELLSELVTVLKSIERCDLCVAPLEDGGIADCHHERYEAVFRRAKAYLAALPKQPN